MNHRNLMLNREGYRDTTCGLALRNILREGSPADRRRVGRGRAQRPAPVRSEQKRREGRLNG